MVKAIILILVLFVWKEKKLVHHLKFKHESDRLAWRSGTGPKNTRRWITALNVISEDVAGRGIVVTSWFRQDRSFHSGGNAFDARRLSGANQHDPKPYTLEEVEKIQEKAVALGLPLVVVRKGTPSEHWHVGDLAI